jgi:hypothetical protein
LFDPGHVSFSQKNFYVSSILSGDLRVDRFKLQMLDSAVRPLPGL